MPVYRIEFVDHADRIYSTTERWFADDEEAIADSRLLFSTRIGKGYSIWDGTRHVHTETLR